jgi:hypothetical protein
MAEIGLPESLSKLLQAPLLRWLVKLFTKITTAERYVRRRSQSWIIRQHRLAEEANGIFKLGAMWFLKLECVHHGASTETGKLRLSPQTRKTKAQQSAFETRWLMSDLLSKDQPPTSLSRDFGATYGRAARSSPMLLLNFAPEMMQRKLGLG